MLASIGPVLLILGIILVAGSQWAIGLHAFTQSPLHGVLCFTVPLYVYVHARKHKVGLKLMRAWYAGLVLFVAGGVLSS